MKRNDVLVLLAGFVATGLAWRYQAAKWGIPVAIASAIAFLFIHFFWKERPPQNREAASVKDSFNPMQSVTGQSLENVGNPVQNANPKATATIEQHQHFYLQQPVHPPTNSAESSDLEITWKPEEGEPYVHTYPPGTTDNIQYRIRVVNNGAKHLTDAKVWLDKLNPLPPICPVPCIMKLMHDNQDPGGPIPIGPFVTEFSLPPHGGRFIDLLLQWPNGSEFWVLHTVIKVDRRIPAQTYTLTIIVEAANTNPGTKSFRLVKSGQIWNMIEIETTPHPA